tara:strand:+ start:113 stop:1036 length:924 start_codon:yes stop_codon:yes gene_type:complete
MSKFNEFVEDLRNAVVVKDEEAFSKYVDLCRNGVEFAMENGYTKWKRPAESGYECHRVLTGALGGEYVSGNESYLSQGEHLEAHYWLHIAVPSERKFASPIWRMCNGNLPTTIADLELAKEIYRVGKKAHVESLKEMNADPEFRSARSAQMKAMNADPEFKASSIARTKAMNADPEFKSKMKDMRAAPEYKAKLSSWSKAMHDDPDFKAANSARMKAKNALQDRPWKRPVVKTRPQLLEIWTILDQVHDYVTETGHSYARCAKHFGYKPTRTWCTMVNYVRKNGDPRLDSEFLEFQSNQLVVLSQTC